MAYVTYNEDSLAAYLNSSLFEYSEDYGIKENVNSIDINLGTSRWNVSNIKCNITDIYFTKEIKIIEDQPDLSMEIDNKNHRLGVQIQIEDPTIIYGVHIYTKKCYAYKTIDLNFSPFLIFFLFP